MKTEQALRAFEGRGHAGRQELSGDKDKGEILSCEFCSEINMFKTRTISLSSWFIICHLGIFTRV
jgi:hypothetical protein